jgi:DNA topoisomerase-1
MDGEPQINGNAADAEDVGLRYVRDGAAGIVRSRRGSGFIYRLPDGKRLRDEAALGRIRALAIPPAWTDVWICPSARGHLQAIGRDARGRKQYRYHAAFRALRDENKFARLASFARALPRIRRKVRADLRREGLPRDKVIAAVVRLLETTFIRVGNEEYARQNGSFGLTTMRNRHVRVNGHRIRFQFRGKSGKEHAIQLDDPQLARIVRRCRELPGYELFQYVEEGERRSVDSADINAYLQAITGSEYSAKDFRTWGGTLMAGLALARRPPPRNKTQARREVNEAVRAAAEELGNTVAICRKSYVHPRVVEAYATGKLARSRGVAARGLSVDERRILALLER